jgi:tRNA(Ile2) C34 agmatinyltransferase TiaS
MPEETKPVCPRCGSTLVVEFANMKRCNQCGHQFDLERFPIVARARAERSERTGWKRPQK